jgi:protein-L-isoaspartate(D-aspartate) O-methyltransferase
MAGGDDREGFAAFILRLRGAGIASRELFAALEATPRRNFVAAPWQSVAWSDRMIPIDCGEAIEGADLQATTLLALDVQPGMRVLEIGTGSGYTAAVLGRLAGRVISVDRYKALVEQARARIEALGIQTVHVRQADGSNGLPADGPFDRIVCWAAFDSLPRSFVDQLAVGGIMITPIGPGDDIQELAKLTKLGSRFEREEIGKVRLQPVMPGLAAAL